MAEELVANFTLNNTEFDALFEINAQGAYWGAIQGDINNQTDLINILDNLSGGIDSNHQAIGEINTTISSYGNIVTHNVAEFATSAQGALANTALQPNDNITELVNNAGYITSADLPTLADLTTTEQLNAINSGITSSDVTQISTNADNISDIEDLIPSQASSSNQLADKDFVNSSIATNTANFIGTFNSVAELEAYTGTVTNNDYAFVIVTDSAGNTAYDRYKYNANEDEWLFEYELNNSSFTAAQWAAINSGITSGDVALINSAVQPSDLATVATSGSYNDLTNKPTIPTVNNPTITLTQGGATKGTFTLNQNNNATIDFDNSGASSVSQLTDVELTDLTNGQGLLYNSTTQKWENATISGGGGTVDQTYDPTSANAQSGVAINGAGFLTNDELVSRSVTSSSLLFSTASANGYIETIQTYTFADLYKVDCIHKCGNSRTNYYTSVNSPFLVLYKDANNYFGIEREGYNLRLINVINGTAVNTEEWTSGINSINTYINLYLSLNFVNKKMAIIGSNNSGTITTLFTFDFSAWNITLDEFKIRISSGKYSGNQYNVYLRTNDCYNYEEILNYKFQVNNYNSLPVIADGEKCSLPTTLYIDGTVTSTISDTHKISNATISSLNYFMLSSGHDNYLTDYFVTSLVKFRITSGSAEIHAGVWISSFILMDENFTLLYDASASENYTLTNNTWYYLYVKGVGNQQWNYTRRYGVKFEGTFTVEAIAEFIGYPRSQNLCAETFDGKYFSGAIPMTSDKTSFEEVVFTKSMNGFQVPIGAIVTDTTSISMYNGTSWVDTKSFVVNEATGTNSLTIFGTAATAANAINIGATSSMAGGSYSVAIGYASKCNSSNAIAIGRGASVGSNARDVIAMGYNARIAANANYAIQLGNGQNSTASTLSVGFNNNNYQLLDGSTGLIPSGRIPIDNSTITVNASGQLQSTAGGAVDSVNGQTGTVVLTASDVGAITSSAIANMQVTTNLVTSVSSSSTDSQYPSAKLFYDTCGDIETAINTIRGV